MGSTTTQSKKSNPPFIHNKEDQVTTDDQYWVPFLIVRRTKWNKLCFSLQQFHRHCHPKHFGLWADVPSSRALLSQFLSAQTTFHRDDYLGPKWLLCFGKIYLMRLPSLHLSVLKTWDDDSWLKQPGKG